jgi:Ni,Fe-hydrogenase I cytochrome b subunit
MKSDQFLLEHWVEVLAAALLLIGLFIGIAIRSSILHYITMLLAGVLSGKIIYQKHKSQPIFPFILMIFAFFLGYLIGSFSANKLALIVLFLFGAVLSYWAHKKGHVHLFKSEGFIK